MKRLAFFDTDILIYADDASSPQKQTRAIELITDYQRSNLAVVSLQVMQVTRKLGVDPETALRRTTTKFAERYERALERARNEGVDLGSLGEDELLAYFRDRG